MILGEEGVLIHVVTKMTISIATEVLTLHVQCKVGHPMISLTTPAMISKEFLQCKTN